MEDNRSVESPSRGCCDPKQPPVAHQQLSHLCTQPLVTCDRIALKKGGGTFQYVVKRHLVIKPVWSELIISLSVSYSRCVGTVSPDRDICLPLCDDLPVHEVGV